MESSVCPERATHRGAVKYEQLLMNRTAETQFRGPGELHLRGENLIIPVLSACDAPVVKARTKPSHFCGA